MDRIKLKICGLRDNIGEVVALRPDYIGLIFYPKSPRYVGEDFELPGIDRSIKKVGVFVNETIESVVEKAIKYQLDFVQLHGDESADYCRLIKEKGLKSMKAFQVEEGFDFVVLEPYEMHVEYFLFDTKSKGYGGSGHSFDWSVLQNYAMEKQYFLSGGLSLENIEGLRGLDVSKIHALDVNSKFEVKPGLKDVGLLAKLKKQIATK